MSGRNEQAIRHTPLEAVNIALARLERIAIVFNKMNKDEQCSGWKND